MEIIKKADYNRKHVKSNGIVPSRYQKDIYNFITNGEGHAVVEAVAGSGKTYTIVNALNLIPRDKSVIFLAFNKHIANELKQRVPRNVYAATFHSFGLRTLNENVDGKIYVNTNKFYDIFNSVTEEMQLVKSKRNELNTQIRQLTSLIKGTTMKVNEDNIDFLIDRYNIEIDCEINIVTKIIDRILKLSLKNINVIDFDDMIWIPVKCNMSWKKFDYVFVDEAQDLNMSQISIIKRCVKNDGRVIAVGDRNQSLYGFRGADSEAIPNIINSLNAKILPLSITYRCPRLCVELAQEIVPEIEAADNAEEGIVKDITIDEMISNIRPGDMVICRYNAPLVGPAFELLEQGVKVLIKGRDIGLNLINIINKLKAVDLDDLCEKLDDWRYREVKKAERKKKSTELIEDKYGVIMSFVSNVDDISSLIRYIERIFSDNTAEVTFSSIHRAKGLESDRVYLLHPDLMPSEYATKDWEIKQEDNCRYVAYTRAKKELYMVD